MRDHGVAINHHDCFRRLAFLRERRVCGGCCVASAALMCVLPELLPRRHSFEMPTISSVGSIQLFAELSQS